MQRQLARFASPDTVHFYSSSGGNAGLACVHAAKCIGRPATVVVPLSTKPLMLTKIRAAGAADVIQHGESWKEADTYLRETLLVEAEKKGERTIYVPPFDHEDIWAGNSTLVEELQTQMPNAPDVVVCSVGGGGLFNGIVEGLETAGWEDTQVLAMETNGADSLNKSMEKKEQVTLPGISSQATSLGATKVSDRTYWLATTRRQHKSAVLDDAEAAMGCWRLADDERFLVELACGVNVALCYGGRLAKALDRKVKPSEKVVIVLCGGSNVTVDMISEWKQIYGHLEDETNHEEQKTVPSVASLPDGTNGVH